MSVDEGGDAPCWAHLFDDESGCAVAAEQVVVVDVGATDTDGRSGVVWSLPHGGDLDANLVHLDPGDAIGAHVNDEVDVLVWVIAGRGRLVVDGTCLELHGCVLVSIPKGRRREVEAGTDGITYFSIHRRRGPLAISTDRKAVDDAVEQVSGRE